MTKIPKAFDVRRLLVPHIDAHGIYRGGFESRADARREKRLRVKMLSCEGNAQMDLAAVLNHCRCRRRCRSLACPQCNRLVRLRWCSRVLEFLDDFPLDELRFITLINPRDAVESGHLWDFEPKKLVTRTRRQLERAGVIKERSFLIGAVDGEWDEGYRLYRPHQHLIGSVDAEEGLRALVGRWPSDPAVRVRARIEPISDLPRTVAYCFKLYWPCVARVRNPNGLHSHGKRRPTRKVESEILEWFDRWSPSELRIQYGVRAHGAMRKT